MMKLWTIFNPCRQLHHKSQKMLNFFLKIMYVHIWHVCPYLGSELAERESSEAENKIGEEISLIHSGSLGGLENLVAKLYTYFW